MNAITYTLAIADLRSLLRKIGRHEFRQFGYARQLRSYRAFRRMATLAG